MRRREFIAGRGAAGGYATMPRFARAQQDARVRRLAMLVVLGATTYLARLRNELAKVGWVEGRNLQIDLRFIRGDAGSCPGNCSVWKKRPELQAYSRFTLQDDCGLLVATGAVL